MQNEERINSLENQVRTLKRIVYGFGCLFVAGVIVSATSLQTVPDVIQAKKFEVVNDEGNVIALLGSNYPKTGGTLEVSNNDAAVLASLSANEDAGWLNIRCGSLYPLIEIYADEKMSGVVSLRNKDGRSVASLSGTLDGKYSATLDIKKDGKYYSFP